MSTLQTAYTLSTLVSASYDARVPYPSQIDAERIGAVGLDVVERAGWDDWSLRDVAKQLDVTPNALYRHVDGRSGLLVEIGSHAARHLAESLTTPKESQDPLAAVVAVGERYVDFAVSRPHAYAAFTAAKPDIDNPAVEPWLALWVTVRSIVADAVPDSPDAAAFALWALIHGRVSLASGPARMASATAGLADAIRALLAGFRAGEPVASPVPPFDTTHSPPLG